MTRRLLPTALVLLISLVALHGWNQHQGVSGQQEEPLHLRRQSRSLKAQIISILDANQPFNTDGTPAEVVVTTTPSKESSVSVTLDETSNTNVNNQQPKVDSIKPAEVISDEASSALSAIHDPVLSTLAEKRPCGTVPAVVKTVIPTWLASYPESGSQETWRLIQAVTGLMTDEDVTNHGHALAGKAVIVKTHFPSHTPADAFEKFQSKLLIQKAVLLIRNPIYAIPALHKFKYSEETKTDIAKVKRIPIEHWIQWRNTNFELELSRWMDQIRWWVFHYQQVRFDKLMLIPYERLVSAGTGVDELWKLAFYLRSVDRSIVDSMIPLENFQCLWEFVIGPLSKQEQHQSSAHPGGVQPGPFTSSQLQLIRKALENIRDEYMTSYHELASVAQLYLMDVDRLITSIADVTN